MIDRLGSTSGNVSAFSVTELCRSSAAVLTDLARREGLPSWGRETRVELAARILQHRLTHGSPGSVEGILELNADGDGLLRRPEFDFQPGPCDVYVAPSQVERYGLRTGDAVTGPLRPPREGECLCGLLRVERVNGLEPDDLRGIALFEEREPRYPEERLRLESDPKDLTSRVLDLLTPLARGQRGLIVAPPRAGTTTLLRGIARAIARNHPECVVQILLVGERPEDIARLREELPGVEVIGSTFDEDTARQVRLATLVVERAKRLAEVGRDVVLLVDSLTWLARAWNVEDLAAGRYNPRWISTGPSSYLAGVKSFWGSARELEGPGSLTILATARIDTGSRMDEVIFEELKGCGNMELHLDRRLVDRGLWPAIDINRSWVMREERVVPAGELRRRQTLRAVLRDMSPVEAMELLLSRLGRTTSNQAFLDSMSLSG